MSIEQEIELAEHTLREIMRQDASHEVGWQTNRRANLYAVEAEIRRLNQQIHLSNQGDSAGAMEQKGRRL